LITTIKYDTDGNEQWTNRYNGLINDEDGATDVKIDNEGNIYVVGTSKSIYVHDFITIKYHPSGYELWHKMYNGRYEDYVTSVAIDSNNNVYITGNSTAHDTFENFATIKYDSLGNEQWIKRNNSSGFRCSGSSAIAVDDFGNIYVAGNSIGDWMIIKYSQNISPAVPDGANGWFKTMPSVSLSPNEVSNTYYSWSSSNGPWLLYSIPFTALSGENTLYYYSEDTSNNLESVRNYGFKVDTTFPITTPSIVGGVYSSTQHITLLCDDDAGSGCDKIYYTLDGSMPTINSSVYTIPIMISETTTLKFFGIDLAGNNENIKTELYTINIDSSPPTGTIVINADASYTNSLTATLTLTCSDSESGCSQMQFSNDNIDWLTPEAYAESKTWSLPSGDGTKTVYVKFGDAAGNWSGAYSDTIVLDTIVPTTTASPAGGTYTSAQDVTLSCSDSTGSGCASTLYCLGAGCTPSTTYSGAITIAGSETLRFSSTDNAGNSESVKSEEYTITVLPLEISTSSLPSGMMNIAYSAPLTAAGGTEPYDWSISAGSLPPGLGLNSSTGVIAGTPSSSGTFSFTVQVTDAAFATAVRNLSITIQSYPVRVISPPRYFSAIQDAYDACNEGDTIEIIAQDFFENLIFDLPGLIYLRGGCDADFVNNPSFTTINGSLTITDGTVDIENIIIK